MPEKAGLRAGPVRGASRGPARRVRPSGRPRPGARPGIPRKQPAHWPVLADAQAGRAGMCDDDADTAGDQNRAAEEGKRERGKKQKDAGLTRELVGVVGVGGEGRTVTISCSIAVAGEGGG